MEQIVGDLSGKTNRTLEAVAKHYEAELIDCLPEQPPRVCELSDQSKFIDSVAIPESAADLIKELCDRESLPLSENAQSFLEKLVAEFNGVGPDTICCSSNLIVIGRGWKWSMTEKLTGFEYWPTSEDSER